MIESLTYVAWGVCIPMIWWTFMRVWLSGLCALVVVIATPLAAISQTSVTTTAKVYPLLESGALTGCQVAFSVLRDDLEYSDGRPALVNGLVIFAANGGMMMRLGVSNDPEFKIFAPPARAYLYDAFKSNVADFVKRGDSSEEGFALFIFRAGEDTVNMLGKLVETGTIDVIYAPIDATVDARFTFNLASQQPQYVEFLKCVSTLLEKLK